MANHYSFLWSKKFLAGFLERFSDVYIFGGSGNIANVFDLFDKVYFLKVEPEFQKERLRSASRPNPMIDKNEDGVVVWGNWLEDFANGGGIL
jgi:hypothetical protein